MTQTTRPPTVAGSFYPGDPAALESAVAEFLAAARRRPGDGRPKAVVVPHAGYIYSGPVAAAAYAALEPLAGEVTRVVLIGPSHYLPFRGIAAPEAAAFATPLGRLRVDREAIAAIADLPQVVIADAPHEREHALEVQLPFLQKVLGDIAVVPLAVGEATAEEVAAVLARLWDGPQTVIVVSSDLSHYHDYGTAQRRDAATAEAIEALAETRLGPNDACGYQPIAGLLVEARRRGLAAVRLDLRSSGDTAGPRDRVVGYGAWLFRAGRAEP